MLRWFKKRTTGRKSVDLGPDFSDVTTRAIAEQFAARGELEKIFLLPPEFGGSDIPENVTYVPIGTARMKSDIDNNIVADLVATGTITRYVATPTYQGRSFVPTAIRIVASNPGQFEATIVFWGEALRESGA